MTLRHAMLILPGCLTLTASAQSFDIISPAAGLRDTFAVAVSDDGRVVHGQSETRGGAGFPVGYFWNRDTGRSDYTAPTPPAWALTYGGSGDGRFGVGEWSPGNGHRPVAFRYSSASGLETLDEEGVSVASRATDASLDGSTVVGVWERPGFVRQAFVWAAGGGMRGIGVLHPNDFNSEATAVNASGTVVVGSSDDRDGGRHAFRWTASDGMLELPSLAGTGLGSTGALAINDLGDIAVGFSGRHAVVWRDGGVEALPELITPSATYARAVSSDGRVIVGRTDAPNVALATVWTAAGAQYLGDYIRQFGITTPDGFTYLDCTSVSADGRTFCGYGYTAPLAAIQAFVVSVPSAPSLAVGAMALPFLQRKRS